MNELELIKIIENSKEILTLDKLMDITHCSISTIKRCKLNADLKYPGKIKTKTGRKGGYYIIP